MISEITSVIEKAHAGDDLTRDELAALLVARDEGACREIYAAANEV